MYIYANFYWKIQETDKDDYHVVAVNCDQRHLFCNTLGIIPFATKQVNESNKTHVRVSTILRNSTVFCVYRIIEQNNQTNIILVHVTIVNYWNQLVECVS